MSFTLETPKQIKKPAVRAELVDVHIDAESFKANVRFRLLDEDNETVEVLESRGWIELLDANGEPNVPIEQMAAFQSALQNVKMLAYLIGQREGLLPAGSIS